MKTAKKAVRKAAESRIKAMAEKQAPKCVGVTIERGNVLTAPGDVLALKYAQARHGADRGAAELFRAAGRTLPKPGEWTAAKLVDSPEGIKARHTLVVGTHRLWEHEPEFRYQFGYGDVRRLNEMFLSALVGHSVKSVVTTLHGEGVELDLFGAFDLTIAGFQSAVARGQFPNNLERVSIVTQSAEKQAILRRRLSEILPNGIIEADAPAVQAAAPQGSPDVFVAMSFHPKLDSAYLKIEEGVHGVKWGDERTLTCLRLDRDEAGLKPGALLPQIIRNIRKAEFVIAFLTPAPGDKLPRPNVAFEVGCARQMLGNGKVLLVADKKADVRKKFSDLAGEFWVEYDSSGELAEQVRKKLTGMVKRNEINKRK